MSRPTDDDDDFYDEEALLNIEPEDVDEPEQDDPSEDGIDDDFLKELGKAKQTPFKRALKYFIFLLKGSANKKVRIVNLPHPKTGTLRYELVLLTSDSNKNKFVFYRLSCKIHHQ